MTNALHHFLYASSATFGSIEVALRTVVVYLFAIAIVRVGKKKFMGQHTGFDTLIAFILGSVLSRAINGSSPLPQTIVAGFVLIGIHWLLTMAAQRSKFLSQLMNGRAFEIVHDGTPLVDVMREHGLSTEDLMEAIRSNGRVGNLDEVHSACLERSGRISVLPAKSQTRIIEVDVKEGVQRIVVEIR